MLPPMYFKLFPKWKSLLGLLVVLAFPFLLSACATLDEGDCRDGNWAGIGFNDAAAGLRSNSQLRQHDKACSRYKITSNKDVYFSGYAKGLKQFCSQENGLRHGSSSLEYYGVCPAVAERTFLTGYLPGIALSIHSLEDEIDIRRHERRKRHHRLMRLKRTKSDKKDRKDRKKFIRKLEDDIDSLESGISSRRSDISRLLSWHAKWSLKLK